MKAKGLAFAKSFNIGPTSIGTKYRLVMNKQFRTLRQGSKTFIDQKERDTIRGTQFQLRNTPKVI